MTPDDFERVAAEYTAANWVRVDGRGVDWSEIVHSSSLSGLKRRLSAAMGGADERAVTFRDGTRLTARVYRPAAGCGFTFEVIVEVNPKPTEDTAHART